MFSGDDYELTPISEVASGRVLVPHCYRTCSRAASRKGLLGLASLPDGYGLLLGEALVHVLGMRFPIDLVFIGRDHKVVALAPEVSPGLRLRGHWRARYVLELPAGGADAFTRGLALSF